MRKSLIYVLVALLAMVFPSLAGAQSAVSIEKLSVQFWPEFDQPKVLVIYDFTLSPDVTLPATVSLRVPTNANVLAVAQEENGGLVTIPADSSQEGDWQVIKLEVSTQTSYRVEYYVPFTKAGDVRNYSFTWPGDYAVKTLSVLLQQPVDATDTKTTPTLENIGVGDFNLTYFAGDAVNLAAGQEYKLEFSYSKPNDTLSASSVAVEPSGDNTALDNVSGQNVLSTYLPWILGIVGVLLIFGGVVWYWQTGKGSESPRARRRHTRTPDEDDDDDEDDGQVYCPQCGKRAKPGDRFCRACGSKIRAKE